MEKSEIKKEALKLFNQQDFAGAIDVLAQLGVNEFVNYTLRTNHREKKKSWFRSSGFCLELSKRNKLFLEIFKHELATELLFEYYTHASFTPTFEQKLANEHPTLFVDAVRVSLAFLEKGRLEFYLELSLPGDLELHQKTWSYMCWHEGKLWSQVEISLSGLIQSKETLEAILTGTIIWLEEQRFNDSSNDNIYNLASVYNTFISVYLNKTSTKDVKEDFSEGFLKVFIQTLSQDNKIESLENLLNAISEWVSYRDRILFPYCYDKKITLFDNNSIIHFKREPEAYYGWKLDGSRYTLNVLDYFSKSDYFLKTLLEESLLKIPKGKSERDYRANLELAIQEIQILFLMDDLKISNFVSSNKKIPVKDLVIRLITNVKNRSFRFEERIAELYSQLKNSKKAMEYLIFEGFKKGIVILPYMLENRDEYIKSNHDLFPKSNITHEDVVNLFSSKINPQNHFDRFKRNYDVWYKPFLMLGDFIFCPMLFYANNDWFYALAQAGIENLHSKYAGEERKQTATEMEVYLGECLKKPNWSVKVFDDKEASSIQGDVDILVNDGDTSLLIQLKRTQFRTDLKQAYFEYINTDKKAANQLNQAEESLRSDNSPIQIGSNVHKWIVSTSFENILTSIDGCLKVNYLDLLRTIESSGIDNLKQLIDYCETDGWLRELRETKCFGLPISMASPSAYIQPIIAMNENYSDYNQKINKASDLYHEGKFEKAISILEVCRGENPDDYEVWATLGNCYADLERFNESYECFERALTLLPDDPYICRNYAIALREGGCFDKALEISMYLRNKYWYLMLH